jgi:hypothetical protein
LAVEVSQMFIKGAFMAGSNLPIRLQALFCFVVIATIHASGSATAQIACKDKPFPENLSCNPLPVPDQPTGGIWIPVNPNYQDGGLVAPVAPADTLHSDMEKLQQQKIFLPKINGQ